MASVQFSLALTMFVNFLAALDAAPMLTCPPVFTLVGADCYLVTPQAAPRPFGVKYCKSFNAGLAAINSQEQMDGVAGILNVSVYLGVNDIMEEGTFVNPGGEVANYTNFLTGEPDNIGNEDCVVAKDNKDYGWNDVKCSKEFNTLCQLAATQHICQNGEIYDESTCFLAPGSEVKTTYTEAIAYCQTKGMQLASIHSQTEQDFVKKLTKATTWIGLNDRDSEGSFTWIDDTPVEYFNWINGEPNNLRNNENCVDMRPIKKWGWNDANCDNTFQVLCRGPTTVV